jgi:hypothetical protein
MSDLSVLCAQITEIRRAVATKKEPQSVALGVLADSCWDVDLLIYEFALPKAKAL